MLGPVGPKDVVVHHHMHDINFGGWRSSHTVSMQNAQLALTAGAGQAVATCQLALLVIS
jgi:ABC-type enterochelin transport system ATPase subunit